MAMSTIDKERPPEDLKEGETFNPPLLENQVGGELLNILSKGLYTDPLDAIREYVQNSIDASSDSVEIQITGNSVFILDHGDGMDYGALLQAREFAVSNKDMAINVGFRGIGIYSGFDLCNRLVIRTKTAAEEVEHILEFKFGDMRKRLDAARQDPERPAVPLITLLHENIFYRFEKSSRKDRSFTLVQLEDLSDTHIQRLSHIGGMTSYILRNLPIRFSSKFKHGKDIEKALQKNVDGYKSARIILKIEKSEPVIVEKPNIPDLESPKMGFIYDSGGKPLAYYWACLTSVSKSLSARDYSEFAGLVYKIKGFTIGDRNHLSSFFTRKQMYPWWTGEIYITTTEVIPTSARDDFEANSAKDALEAAVKYTLSGAQNKDSLQKIALEAQANRQADETIDKATARIQEVKQKIADAIYDEFQAYSVLDNIIDDLQTQRGKASPEKKKLATRLITSATSLQKQVKKELDQPTPSAMRKRKSAEQASKQPTDAKQETSSKALPLLSLQDVVKKSGWNMTEEGLQLIALIGAAIIDNLGAESPLYRHLIEDIEARLSDVEAG